MDATGEAEIVRVLVVGLGSIGMRHARLLQELGCDVAAVTARRDITLPVFSELASALAAHRPSIVVIANTTNLHYSTLQELSALGFTGRVLVEKPLFDQPRDLPASSFASLHVGYNLRFHPVIQRVRDLIRTERVLMAQAYVGQYLPEWRPGTNYNVSYSADAERGGGVLRDLSHELDFLTTFFGKWTAIAAIGGHFGSLDITSDDAQSLLIRMENCPAVAIQMNYLDRMGRRFILINTDTRTIKADLVSGTITIDRHVEKLTVAGDTSYLAMHRALIEGTFRELCSADEGLATLGLIEAVEKAERLEKWIFR